MNKTILVTGDCICDHNFYKGKRPKADSKEQRGFRYYCKGGGALLLKEVIAETMNVKTMESDAEFKVEFDLDEDFIRLPLAYHSFCLWEPQVGNPADDPKNQVQYWRAVEPPFGYGHKTAALQPGLAPKPRASAYSPNPTQCTDMPDIVVIDDAGIGFREHKELWACINPDSSKSSPQWIVLKLTGPVGTSPLWDEITCQCKNNLVVIVPAEELRRRDVRLSKGLSWEATAEDLTAELHNNPLLTPLLKARHLIVTFQSDAAFWLDNNPEFATSLLVFDASRAEGEWSESQGKGGAFGYLSCLTAAVVRELCLPSDKSETDKIKPDLETAIGRGLRAGRELRQLGHGCVTQKEKQSDGSEKDVDNPNVGFPFAEIAAQISQQTVQPKHKFVSALIPQKFVNSQMPQEGRVRGKWMMLDEWQVQALKEAKPRPHYDAALAVAVLGSEALERFPVAKFGNYQTVDRKEIESLRTIRQLINSYMKVERPKTPLNLGVFGPPGSGKSFIVLEIAKAVGIKEDDIEIFNLSQFSEVADLYGAFHQVRDKILKGSTPLVFWDEFDAREYKWLQYLLAPMEDGEFQDGQITHPIGKCIFVFAGATSATYDKFGPCNPDLLSKDELDGLSEPHRQEVERLWRQFVLAKGPDFKSRLVGHLNLLGMNRRQKCIEKEGRRRWVNDDSDIYYPIRRAIFIRSVFKCKKGERLDFDQSVLRAMLEIPVYKSAGRSVQVLCNHLRENSSGRPNRSGLPGYDLLDMHVNAEKFWKLCERSFKFASAAADLAQGLHEDYLLALTDGDRKDNPSAVPWEQLSQDLRDSNFAQAERIPDILAIAGLKLVRGELLSADDTAEVNKILEEHAEVLAEAEHNGWMVERILKDWRYARISKKDVANKLSPFIIPYAQLPDVQKEKDRRVVSGQKASGTTPEILNYFERIQHVGFRIERVKKEVKVQLSSK